MSFETNVVKRLRIEATTSGVDDAARKLEKLTDAYDDIGGAATSMGSQGVGALEQIGFTAERVGPKIREISRPFFSAIADLRTVKDVARIDEYVDRQKRLYESLLGIQLSWYRQTRKIYEDGSVFEQRRFSEKDLGTRWAPVLEDLQKLKQFENASNFDKLIKSQMALTVGQGNVAKGMMQAQNAMVEQQAAVEGLTGKYGELGFASTALFVAGFGGAAASVVLLLEKLGTLREELSQTAELSRATGFSLSGIQETRYAGALKGANDNQVNSSLENMARLLNEAARDENSLSKLLDENNIKFKDRNGDLITTTKLMGVAADFMKRARTPQDEREIAKAFGIDEKLIPALRNGADEFERLKEKARAAGAVVSDETIAKAVEFEEKWRASSAKWSAYMKAAMAEILPVIDDLIDKAKQFSQDGRLATMADSVIRKGVLTLPAMTEKPAEEFNLVEAQAALDLFKARGEEIDEKYRAVFEGIIYQSKAVSEAFDALGEAAVASAAMATRSWAEVKTDIPTLDISYLTKSTKIPSKDSGSGKANEYDRLSKSIERHVAALEGEAKAVGGSVGEQARMRDEMRLYEAATQAGIKVTDEFRAKVEALAQRSGDAAQKLAELKLKSDLGFEGATGLMGSTDQQIAGRLRSIYGDKGWQDKMDGAIASQMRFNDALRQTGSLLESNITSGLVDALDGTKSWGDAMRDTSKMIVRALEEMLIKLYVVGPLMRSLSGGLSGGGGSFLSGLFGSANGNVFAGGNVIPFARGGVVTGPTLFPMANGAGLMGEAGPEAVIPLQRTADGRLGVAAQGGGAISVAPIINVNMPTGGSKQDGVAFGNEIGRTVAAIVRDTLVRERRAGGLLTGS